MKLMKKTIILSVSVLFFSVLCFTTLNAHNIYLKGCGTHNFQDTLKQKVITDTSSYKIDLKDWGKVFDMVRDKYPTLYKAKVLYIPKKGNATLSEIEGRIHYTTNFFSNNPQIGDILMISDIVILDSNKQKVKIKQGLSFTAK
jgi:hypothetical protein